MKWVLVVVVALVGGVGAACVQAPPAAGEAATRGGEIRRAATPRCIGIEWDITGDADHDATCGVEVRPKGETAWKRVLPLFRVDFEGWYGDTKGDRRYNMLAGSLLFLKPGSDYEVRLSLNDPDGGSTTQTVAIATRAEPQLPRGGRTLHVAPGSGGGDGSAAQPFRGLKAAEVAAKAGDTLLLHAGSYGAAVLAKGGEAGKYLAWKAAGDGAPVFDRMDVGGSHVWIEGLTLKRGTEPNGLKARGGPADVVVRRCDFQGFHYSVFLTKDCRDWTIADNTIVGDNDPASGSLDGEGVELNHGSGHVVAHNRISRTADGVSYPHRDCDIYGNDIFDISDDGLEPDYGYANVRMWENRVTNPTNHGISFQPMYCGPWYFIRNQVIGGDMTFKFRVQDRFLLVNNTLVGWNWIGDRMHHLLTSYSRNNLYLLAGGRGPLWVAVDCRQREYCLPNNYRPTWATDVDYDGFDWGDNERAFRWANTQFFPDVASFAQAVGIEKHGVRVRKQEIITDWNLPATRQVVPVRNLTLRAGSSAVDAGAPVPGITDGFRGKAPDLGAFEEGAAETGFGPRGSQK